MTTVALAISSMRAGGAERVMAGLCSHLAAAGHSVVLITWDREDADFYRPDPRVRRIGLGLLAESDSAVDRVTGNLQRVRALRRTLRQARADIAISFVDQMNVAALLASLGTGLPVIVSERVDPRHYVIGGAWAALRRATYPLAAALVVQTQAVAAWAAAFVPAGRVHVIANPVTAPSPGTEPTPPARDAGLRFLAVGRLGPQKGFDMLIRAFARCRAVEPGLRLTIAGEGPDGDGLRRLAAECGVADAVQMPGTVRDIGKLYLESDVFVLSSRFEGFPNVLLEAMSHGCPPVAFDCPSGPGEVIRDGVSGILVPPGDEEVLAAAMLRLARDATLRRVLGKGALSVLEAYAPGRIYGQWDRLIGSCLGRA